MNNQLIESPPANARQIVPSNNNGHALAEVPAPPIGNLAGALAAARDRCKTATKDGYNKHHQFAYASADEIIDTAKAALEGSGISPPIPVHTKLTVLGTGSSAIYALDRVLLLAHASGESITLTVEGWPVMPDKGRPLDKAFATALTSSLAYTLRELLQMPRGDAAEDMIARDDRHAAPTPAPQRQPESPANPPAAPQEPASLTEQEYAVLVALARQHQRTAGEVRLLCTIAGVQTLDRVPRSRLEWLQKALVTWLTPAATVDRLSGLIDALGLDHATVPSRLKATYGVGSLAHLLPEQARELEEKFKTALTAKLEREKPLPQQSETATPAA